MLHLKRTILSLTLVVLAACGGGADLAAAPKADDGAPAAAPATTTTETGRLVEEAPGEDAVTTPSPAEDGSAGTSDAPSCSASPVTPSAQQLPADVERMRRFLSDAAGRCDDQALHTAASESSRFTYSFGGEGDFVGYLWRAESQGEPVFRHLGRLLQTTPALADGGEVHVWPRVVTGRPEDTTDEAWDELVPVFGQEEVDRLRGAAGDGYLGWRVGISTDGEFRFFVVGD